MHGQYIPPVLPMSLYLQWWDYFNAEPEPFGFTRKAAAKPKTQTVDQQLAILRGR